VCNVERETARLRRLVAIVDDWELGQSVRPLCMRSTGWRLHSRCCSRSGCSIAIITTDTEFAQAEVAPVTEKEQ
jgi:hypothetical protein